MPNLGYMYEVCNGIIMDKNKAIELYQCAAEKKKKAKNKNLERLGIK